MLSRLAWKYRHFKKEMFYLLLTPHLRVLDCHMISAELTSEEIYRTLRLASITCPVIFNSSVKLFSFVALTLVFILFAAVNKVGNAWQR